MRDNVTILAYHFWADEGYDAAFAKLAHAFEQTWRYCGKLKSVLVVNKVLPCVTEFADRNQNLAIQIEEGLKPGDIASMSEDCISRLYTRFDTPYVLIIQSDGYPLRQGLEEFVGKYDFIGAPYVRIKLWRNLLARVLGIRMCNGGFSLRSRRICKAAADCWFGEKKGQVEAIPAEDIYYTHTLPFHHIGYRFKYRIATNTEAIRFAYDSLVSQPVKDLPFGFHRDCTLKELERLLNEKV